MPPFPHGAALPQQGGTSLPAGTKSPPNHP
jgi:hypothetical protein